MNSSSSKAVTYVLLALLMTPFIGAQTSRPATPQPNPAPKTASSTKGIGFLGASITAGFGSKLTLARALEAVTEEPFAATDASDLLTFMSPDRVARKALPKVQEAEPGVVVALDFLFWFVYGPGKAGYETRKTQLDVGLGHLAKVQGPLYLGLLPHITDANRQMLRRDAVPAKEVLDRINADIRTWAKDRKNVRLMDVPQWLGALKSGGEVTVFGKKSTFTKKEILLPDRLHLTRRGVLIAAALVADDLARGGFLDRKRFAPDLATVEKRADQIGTGFTILVKAPNGKRVRRGQLVIDFDLSKVDLATQAKLIPLANLLRPVDLAERNPLVVRSVPAAALELPTPAVWAYDGELVTDPKSLRLKKGKRRTITLTLRPGAKIEARVLDAEGKPMADVLVTSGTEARARRTSVAEIDVDQVVYAARTDAEGRAVLSGLAPAEHKLVYRRPGTSVWTNGPRVEVDAEAVTKVDIKPR